MNKIEKIQRWLADNNQDIALITNPKTIQYLTGFYSDPVERVLMMVVFKDKDHSSSDQRWKAKQSKIPAGPIRFMAIWIMKSLGNDRRSSSREKYR